MTTMTTLLTINWPPKTVDMPDDANPAYIPIVDLVGTRYLQLNAANIASNIVSTKLATSIEFIDVQSAEEYKNFHIDVLTDLNQVLPQYIITSI
jgi:hypothetical protein